MSFTDVTTFVLFRFSVYCLIKRADEALETWGREEETTEGRIKEADIFREVVNTQKSELRKNVSSANKCACVCVCVCVCVRARARATIAVSQLAKLMVC